MTEREKYTSAITKLHALKQELQSIIHIARGAGEVYLHLSESVDVLNKEVQRLDRKAVQHALDAQPARTITHKVYCADRYGEPCNCGAMQ